MITKSTKLKRNTEWLYNGTPVFIERDRQDGTALIRIGIDQPVFEDVDVCDLKPVNKPRSVISNKPKVLNDKEKSFKKELNVFYASQLLEIPKYCENCERPLYINSKWDGRKMTCHILPKSLFKQLAIHPLNRVFMCCDNGCYGHDKWDNGDALERSQMPVYAIAIGRFNKFKELLIPKDLIKANKYLNL